jgi:hypothetical protein
MANFQKSQIAPKSTGYKHHPEHFVHFMLGLTFGQIEFLEVDQYSVLFFLKKPTYHPIKVDICLQQFVIVLFCQLFDENYNCLVLKQLA